MTNGRAHFRVGICHHEIRIADYQVLGLYHFVLQDSSLQPLAATNDKDALHHVFTQPLTELDP